MAYVCPRCHTCHGGLNCEEYQAWATVERKMADARCAEQQRASDHASARASIIGIAHSIASAHKNGESVDALVIALAAAVERHDKTEMMIG